MYGVSGMCDSPSKQTKRPMRYLIPAPLRYRVHGERMWRHGIARNISDAGIEFESETRNLEIGSRFECQLLLSFQSRSSIGGCLRFDAEVVRHTDDQAWAAQFLKVRLRRASRASSAARTMSL
jgi:hypothetical protein